MRLPCRWVNHLIGQYIDGELSPVKTAIVRKHLKTCKVCNTEMQEMLSLRTILRDVQSEIIPPQYLKKQIISRIESETIPSQKRRWFFQPEFSWGIVTLLVVIFMLSVLIATKPDARACRVVQSLSQRPARVFKKLRQAELSTILKFMPDSPEIIVPNSLALFNLSEYGRGEVIIAQMTVNIDGKVMTYMHGSDSILKPMFPSGVRLYPVNVEGKTFLIGDFKGYRLVYWYSDNKPVAVLLHHRSSQI